MQKDNDRPLKILGVFIGILVVAFIVRALLLGNTPTISLSSAPPLTGSVAQSLGASNGNSLPVYNKDFLLRDTKYTTDKEWAVTTVIPKGTTADTAYVVLKKTNNFYAVVLGPGPYFSHSYTNTLPEDIVNYLAARQAFSDE